MLDAVCKGVAKLSKGKNISVPTKERRQSPGALRQQAASERRNAVVAATSRTHAIACPGKL